MEKYFFKNWATFPFKRKTFDGQMDRFVTVCVVNAETPQKVLDIIPIFGKLIVNLIYDWERGIQLDNESSELLKTLHNPIEGQFEEIKSKDGPLFHRFTPEEVKYGLCPASLIWKQERDQEGKVKVYESIKVFTQYEYYSDIGKYDYANGWFPDQMYKKYYGYRYLPISKI